MKRLVLDKSGLYLPTAALLDLRGRYDLLLTTTLLQELATEDLSSRASMTADEKHILDEKLQARFDKAISVAGNEWVDHLLAMEWEVTNGESARSMQGVKIEQRDEFSKLLLDPMIVQNCLAFDDDKASLASFPVAVRNKRDKKSLADLSKKSEVEFFRELTDSILLTEVSAEVGRTALRIAEKAEKRYGWKRSHRFCPCADWFIYGIALAHMVYLRWRLWKHGTGTPHNPTNAAYDLYYLGFMAIADGLLSSDKGMLKLGWALWPDKRQHIYQCADGQVEAFDPERSSISGG